MLNDDEEGISSAWHSPKFGIIVSQQTGTVNHMNNDIIPLLPFQYALVGAGGSPKIVGHADVDRNSKVRSRCERDHPGVCEAGICFRKA